MSNFPAAVKKNFRVHALFQILLCMPLLPGSLLKCGFQVFIIDCSINYSKRLFLLAKGVDGVQ